MKNPLGFMSELFKQPLWVVTWVNLLMAINLVSVGFLEFTLAKVILGVFVFQAVAMMVMYMYFGFEKVLGLAHLLWFPLLGYMMLSLGDHSGLFLYYLATLSAFLFVSLLFDTYDVITFFKQRDS
jgi:hypothetical protein